MHVCMYGGMCYFPVVRDIPVLRGVRVASIMSAAALIMRKAWSGSPGHTHAGTQTHNSSCKYRTWVVRVVKICCKT
jgi:hypothetical protein